MLTSLLLQLRSTFKIEPISENNYISNRLLTLSLAILQ